MLTRMEVGRLLKQVNEAGDKHQETAFCEAPRTCGGCHFWSGYASALKDVIAGQRLKIWELREYEDRWAEKNDEVTALIHQIDTLEKQLAAGVREEPRT